MAIEDLTLAELSLVLADDTLRGELFAEYARQPRSFAEQAADVRAFLDTPSTVWAAQHCVDVEVVDDIKAMVEELHGRMLAKHANP